jgi:cysteine desulfurase
LGCQKEEVFFTSGGTEGDNLAIFGAIEAKKRRGNTILTTDSEHPAVSQVLKKAKEMGFKVVRIRTKGGELDLEQLSSAATPDVILTTMMLVNNETGAVYDIPAASKIIRKQCPDALIHTDAVQGFLKLPFSPRELHVDLLTVSAHKIHGLKGSGALYVKKGTRILPHMLGGGQEKGLRSGTENTLGIAVFGLACEEGKKNLSSHIRHMASLRQWLLLQLRDIPGVHLNLPSNPVCHILHFSLPGCPSHPVPRRHCRFQRIGLFLQKRKKPCVRSFWTYPRTGRQCHPGQFICSEYTTGYPNFGGKNQKYPIRRYYGKIPLHSAQIWRAYFKRAESPSV